EIRALIRALGEQHAVVLSTHLLPEVEAICDRVLILHQGEPVYAGAVSGPGGTPATALRCRFRRPPPAAALAALAGVDAVEPLADGALRLRHAAAARRSPRPRSPAAGGCSNWWSSGRRWSSCSSS
ncbi:MAG TPA: hypothetical protein VIX81_00510, partial [Gammaproteobacteria bacterium]